MSIVTPAAVMSPTRKIELPAPKPQQRPTGNRDQLDWQPVKTVEDKKIGFVIELQRLPLSKPKFRVSISGLGKNGPTRSINAGIVADQGQAICPSFFGMALARIVDDMLLIAQEEAQKVEDRFMDNKIANEERRIAPPTTAHGPSPLGMNRTQEQKDAKKKRHENNLAERRAVDSSRTNSTKGKSK